MVYIFVQFLSCNCLYSMYLFYVIVCCISYYSIYLMNSSPTYIDPQTLRETRTGREFSKVELGTHWVTNILGVLFVVPTCGLSLFSSLSSSLIIDTIHNYNYNCKTGYWYPPPPLTRGFSSFHSKIRCSFHSLLFVGMWHSSLSLSFDQLFPTLTGGIT